MIELARIEVDEIQAKPCRQREVPAGIVGGLVRLTYTAPVWEKLRKTVVFQSYLVRHNQPAATVILQNPEALVRIPAEVTARAGYFLAIGVFGTDGEENLIIPTLWAELGRIAEAADPSGDESADPALPVWAQLQEQIDDLKENGTGGVSVTVEGETLVIGTGSNGITIENETLIF